MSGRRRSTVWLAALVGLASCRVDKRSFYAASFSCDASALVDQCGTTQDGKPMICYPGSAPGGSDFCAEACDPDADPPRVGTRCLTPGALVQTCAPHGAETDPSLGCPEGLSCYRTDLLADEGVCLMIDVCMDDTDCSGGVRTRCAASLIRDVTSAPLTLDHLSCVKPTCKSSDSVCSANESCLAKYYYLDLSVVDMCVPNCDPHGSCPPNYACAQTPASRGSAAICLPGLPGQRCTREQDCALGSCVDLGVEFKECVPPVPCTTDASCQFLASLATYVCLDVPDVGRRCVATTPFQGGKCAGDSDCVPGQRCFYYSPYVADQGGGECRVPCADDLTCPSRGGIPHVCLDGGNGGCYPGGVGMPCQDGAQCLGGLDCLPVAPDPRSKISSPNICTTTCASDADCDANVVSNLVTFCGDGVCRLAGQEGDPCLLDHQCAAGHCFVDKSGAGTCGG
jgi:hypothetical protein